jgi:hypothetical protein
MSKAIETISVVIASTGGKLKKGYASKNGAVIIDVYNALLEKYDEVAVVTCEVITKAPRVRKARAKSEKRGETQDDTTRS